ncbi:hypothetical protein OROMI_006964 [Orobanche minor]
MSLLYCSLETWVLSSLHFTTSYHILSLLLQALESRMNLDAGHTEAARLAALVVLLTEAAVAKYMVAVSTNLTVVNLISDVKEKVAFMVDDMIDTPRKLLQGTNWTGLNETRTEQNLDKCFDMHAQEKAQQSSCAFISVSRYTSATHIPPYVLSRGVGWQVLGSTQSYAKQQIDNFFGIWAGFFMDRCP